MIRAHLALFISSHPVGSGNSEPFCICWQAFFQVEMTGSPRWSIEVDMAPALKNPIENGRCLLLGINYLQRRSGRFDPVVRQNSVLLGLPATRSVEATAAQVKAHRIR